jgi:hypothetical protein
LAKGVAQVLNKGGRLEINIFGGGVKEWATTFSETLVKNGFDAKNIKIISDVLIQAVNSGQQYRQVSKTRGVTSSVRSRSRKAVTPKLLCPRNSRVAFFV